MNSFKQNWFPLTVAGLFLILWLFPIWSHFYQEKEIKILSANGNEQLVGASTTFSQNASIQLNFEVLGTYASTSGNLSFNGEIMPDGVTCSNDQILKRTGANNWDCAADAGGSVSSNSLNFDEFQNPLVLDTNITTTSGSFTWDFGGTDLLTIGGASFSDNINWLGELKPDGALCSNGQILKKTGANDWDCTADVGGSATSNSLDFDEFVNSMTIDANLTVASASSKYNINWGGTNFLDVGTIIANHGSIFEKQIQVGGIASVAYSRFGTGTTTHGNWISGASDLFLSNDLEGRGSISFAGVSSFSNTLWVSPGGYAGNVGIKTAVPRFPLDVGGVFFGGGDITGVRINTATISSNYGPSGSGTGDIPLRIQSSGNSNLTLSAGSLGGNIILNTGNVGIGTTTVDTKLQIVDSAANEQILHLGNATGTSAVYARVDNLSGTAFMGVEGSVAGNVFTSTTPYSMFFATNQDRDLQFGTGGSIDMTLNASGSLGIGTNTPTVKLEVQGTASASYLLASNTLQVGGFASVAYSRFGTGTTSETHYITGSSDLFISQDLEVNGSVSFAGPASISNVLYVSTLGTGNIGIGTTKPDTKLQIVDSVNEQIFHLGDATGTIAKYTRVDNSSGTAFMGVEGSTAGGVFVGTTPYSMFFATNQDRNLQFGTSGQIMATITSSGSFGIGTNAPVTKLEVQGTASASYFITGNTLQVNGFSSAAYSRFGTSTTGHANYISTTNDLLISGDLEVKGSISAQNASASAFWIPNTAGGLLGDCDAAGDTLNWDLSTGKFTCGADAGTGSGVSSNSLDFDEFVNSMTLDSNLTINRGASNYFIGIGAAPSTVFEVQGTASASYLLASNTLQVGGFASVAYNRFGTSATNKSNYITTTNDISISGDLEVLGSGSFNIASASVFWLPGTSGARLGDCDGANDTLNWDLSTGKFVCGSDGGGGGVSSNSLDWDEFVASMSLDTHTSVASAAFHLNWGAADFNAVGRIFAKFIQLTKTLLIPFGAGGNNDSNGTTAGSVAIDTTSRTFNFGDGTNENVIDPRRCVSRLLSGSALTNKDQRTIFTPDNPFTISLVQATASGSAGLGWNLLTGSRTVPTTKVFNAGKSASGSAVIKYTSFTNAIVGDGGKLDFVVTSTSVNLDSLYIRICGYLDS